MRSKTLDVAVLRITRVNQMWDHLQYIRGKDDIARRWGDTELPLDQLNDILSKRDVAVRLERAKGYPGIKFYRGDTAIETTDMSDAEIEALLETSIEMKNTLRRASSAV